MLLTPTLRQASELGLALTAISVLILAGCGGGSSSSGGTSSGATTTTTVTPFKGRFTSGAVSLLDANGSPVTLVSGGAINASGVASVTFPASVTYPLTVRVTGTFDDETTGGSGVLNTTPLLGLIPAASDAAAASGIPVTVMTHLARNMLPSSGVTAASAVAAITGAASSVLGIPTYNQAMKPPLFDASGKTTDPNTIKLAALANVIGQNGVGTDLGAKLQDLADKLKAGSAVNAVFPPADFSNALAAVNWGGASSVLPASASGVIGIPAFTMPGTPLGNLIAAGIPTCTFGQVLQVSATGLSCVTVSGGATPTLTNFNPASGLAGSTVALTGTNLTAVTEVLFTGPSPSTAFTSATITTHTATSISATVPASLATGGYTISVIYPGGEVAATGTFTVTAAGGGAATAYGSCTYPIQGTCTAFVGSFYVGSSTGGSVINGNMQSSCPSPYIWATASNCSTVNSVGICKNNVGFATETHMTFYSPNTASTGQANCPSPGVWVP